MTTASMCLKKGRNLSSILSLISMENRILAKKVNFKISLNQKEEHKELIILKIFCLFPIKKYYSTSLMIVI